MPSSGGENIADQTNVLICGTGSAAHVMAALLGAQASLSTTLLSLSAKGDDFRQAMGEDGICCQTSDPSGTKATETKTTVGYPQVATASELSSQVKAARVILMAMPAFGHEAYLEALLPHVSDNTTLVLMPAYGCTDLLVQQHLRQLQTGVPRHFHLVLLEQLPWVCRTHELGRRVALMAHKREVNYVAMGFDTEGYPQEPERDAIASPLAILKSIYSGHLGHQQSDQCGAALALSLFNPNAIMHASLMFGFYHCADGLGYGQQHFDTQPLFYQQFSPGAVAHMAAISNEVIEVKRQLLTIQPALAPALHLVRSVHQWMQGAYKLSIQDPSTLASSLRTNRVTNSLKHPMIPATLPNEEQGFKPNFQHRYMTEDVPYGLLPLKGYAALANVSTPALDAVLDWAQALLNTAWLREHQLTEQAKISPARTPQRFGFDSLEKLAQHYG